jgi:hypothetical protein
MAERDVDSEEQPPTEEQALSARQEAAALIERLKAGVG